MVLLRIKSSLIKFWPVLLIILMCVIFFSPYLFKGLIPMPADLIVGSYYPWHDYKWGGYTVGVPVKNPLISDIPSVIYPLRQYAIEQLKTGHLPLWNDLMFSGYPLLATFQTAALYPLNILYLFIPFIHAWSWQIMLQPFLAGIFTYIFLRHLKLSKLASLFGSVAYAFGGFNIFYLEWNVHGHVAAYIPLILFLVDKYISVNKLKYLFLGSLIVAVQILAGYPQLTLFTLILTFFWILFRLWGTDKLFNLLKRFIIIEFFLGFGLLISAIQILPGLELYNLSQRTSEVLDPNISYIPFQQLISLFAPDYFGSSATYNYFGAGNYSSVVGYTGIITLILAFISLAKTKIKDQEIPKFFALIAIICLVGSVDNPISRSVAFIFPSIFGAASMTRLLILFNLSLAVLAGFGLDKLVEFKYKSLNRLCLAPVIILIALSIGTFVSWEYLNAYKNTISNYESVLATLNPYLNHLNISVRNLILPLFLGLVTLILIITVINYKKFNKLIKILLVFLIFFELLRFGWKNTPFVNKEFIFPQTPIIDYLQKQKEPFRISGGGVIPSNMWVPYNLASADGYDAVYPYLQAKMIGVINNLDPASNIMTRYGILERYDERLLGLMNINYLLAIKTNKDSIVDEKGSISYKLKDKSFSPVFEDKSVVVLENKKVLPRAFFVSDWEVIKNDTEALTQILNEKFPLGNKIILASEPLTSAKTSENSSQVSYELYTANESNLKVKTDKSGLLFISDSWYPGWKATVNGEEVDILQADYAFRAISVKAGENLVHMYYQPESFEIGKKISFFSIIILSVICLYPLVIKKIKYNA